MTKGLDLTGELVEIGKLASEDGFDGAVIRRPDGSQVTIKGLRVDEIRNMASFFMAPVHVTITGVA
jgi:hypothetical protein